MRGNVVDWRSPESDMSTWHVKTKVDLSYALQFTVMAMLPKYKALPTLNQTLATT